MPLRMVIASALTIALSGGGAGPVTLETSAQPDTPDAVKLIGARCVFCHGPALMLGFSRRMLDEGGPVLLDAFLARHHAPDDEAREAIVRFLLEPWTQPRE